MTRNLISVFLCLCLWATGAAAQNIWVQIEAHQAQEIAQERAALYARGIDNVQGFSLGSGWYGITIGPFARPDANARLRQLRGDGAIPNDSFVSEGRNHGDQFWPVAGAIPAPNATAEARAEGDQDGPPAVDAPQADNVTVPDVPPDENRVADETPREARENESALTRTQREGLQTALQWAGFYESAIDGAFGRGTRSAMTEWQLANNYDATGVMTTRQRETLITAYNAVLNGMNLQTVRDTATGIEMLIPTGVVTFETYAPPFAEFAPKGDMQAQVLLISQSGDANRLAGLYEILQTLEIVPPTGDRARRENSFVIDAIGADLRSYTQAQYLDDEIKGFMLVWPTDDEARFSRVLAEMKASFTVVDGVLDPGIAPPGSNQAVDLIAGLEVRQPRLSRSGFYVTGAGDVLTTIEAVASCEEITLDSAHTAQVVHQDAETGIAVLTPDAQLSPLAFANFQVAVPRLQSEVAVAGFPYGPVLVSPALTFGRLSDIRGLEDEENITRLALTAQDGDAGGPVFDNGGAVLGMLLPRLPINGQVLPAEVSFAVNAAAIRASLDEAGIAVTTTDTLAFMPPETLTLRAADMTVLVSCW